MEQRSLLSVVHDVPPLLSKERADDPDGLWATKQYGDLKVHEVNIRSCHATRHHLTYDTTMTMHIMQSSVHTMHLFWSTTLGVSVS